MSTLLTSRFWVAAVERSIKTWAQSMVALIGANAVAVTDLDWLQLFAVSGTAAVVSLLTSVASAGIGPHGPSLADESIIEPLRMTTGPDNGTAAHAGEPIDPDKALG